MYAGGSMGGQEDASYTRVEPTVLVEIESRKDSYF